MPSLACGEEVRLTGSFVNNPSYGEQFAVTMFERLMPKEAGSILLYLSSGIIKGVGDATARKIVAEFGSDTLKIIESFPNGLGRTAWK
jgi:exodeoxyribonuclease V alpha subunit